MRLLLHDSHLSRTSRGGWRVICISDSPYFDDERFSYWQRATTLPECLNSYLMAIINGGISKDVEVVS